ncbi:hypothetical protein C6382_02195 [Pseudomonas sp. BBP2017]|nr:hypothetical protein C6382_02195 [Pseudomonas sp. BBP2017]
MAGIISKRALAQLEADNGNPTLSTLETVLNKFGQTISLSHLNPAELNAAIALRRKTGLAFAAPAHPPYSPSDK